MQFGTAIDTREEFSLVPMLDAHGVGVIIGYAIVSPENVVVSKYDELATAIVLFHNLVRRATANRP